MLCLFDIDGTLIDTGGAGMQALIDTTSLLFGDPGPSLDLAGSTDLGIVHGIHQHFGVESTPERIHDYFTAYQQRLNHHLQAGTYPGCALPGALELVSTLHGNDQATIGLLTGNIAGGARMKVDHFGFAGYFAFGAYGCDHHDRNQLGPIALDRASRHTGKSFTAANTWIIGDTPKDIRCARAIGARCLAVATGHFTSSQLADCGADAVVASLEQALDRLLPP